MQAAGLGVAGLSGVYGADAASAQEEVIRLEARHDVQSPAAYADDDGIITEQGGVAAAAEDWKEGRIDTDLLTSTIDHWTTGKSATGDGTPSSGAASRPTRSTTGRTRRSIWSRGTSTPSR